MRRLLERAVDGAQCGFILEVVASIKEMQHTIGIKP